MVCCTFIAAILALILRPFVGAAGRRPLHWRLEPVGVASAAPFDPSPQIGRAASRWASLRHAGAGLALVIRGERNMQIHLGAAMAAVTMGLWLRIGAADWRWILLAIGLVLMAEAFNTALEQACNAVTRDFRPAIKAAKDVAAGAVLIAAMTAALIGASVFAPYVMGAGVGVPYHCGGGAT